MSKLHLLKKPVRKPSLKSLVTNSDHTMENKYFRYLLSKGLLAMTADQVHSYISLPHSEDEINNLISATEEFLKS